MSGMWLIRREIVGWQFIFLFCDRLAGPPIDESRAGIVERIVENGSYSRGLRRPQIAHSRTVVGDGIASGVIGAMG